VKVRLVGVLAFGVMLLCSSASGELMLPSVIGDGMVLQRGTQVAVWGWGDPGTAASVTFRGEQTKATADADGAWLARLPAGAAGGPFELRIVSADAEVVFKDVLVGEVWVAGGQSNMWWAVSKCLNPAEEIAAADYPGIRLYDAGGPNRNGWSRADDPQRTIPDRYWERAEPGNIGGWPGTAYFFARHLHRELQVPVGIIHVSVPGSPIEPWLSTAYAQAHLVEKLELWRCREALYPRALEAYRDALEEWEVKRREAELEGESPPREPRAPRNPATASQRPGRFFNGMVAPVIPFSARGFIWWQGESNASRSMQYRVLFPSLIRDWREAWGAADAPFLYVELADFMGEQEAPVEEAYWPSQRDAQREALRLANVWMACATDLLPPGERTIHPPNKQMAGLRLARIALAKVYGQEGVAWAGPTFRSIRFHRRRGSIRFDHVGTGLTAWGGGQVTGFAIAGADRVWHWADATIVGDTVIVSSPEVREPVAVRYNWANNPVGNLYNEDGLPAPPFRTDDWLLRVAR
jgi:sialate O-acetylesterase